MNLTTLAARTIFRALPARLRRHLISREDIFQLVDAGKGRIGGVDLEIPTVVEQLRLCAMGSAVELVHDGHKVRLRRAVDGVYIGIDNAPELHSPDLGLLDADAQVRLASIRAFAAHVLPVFPNADQWTSLLDKRPLKASELGAVLDARETSPSRFLLRISSATELAIDDFFPDEPTYYSALIGAPTSASHSGDPSPFLEHVRCALSINTEWGWRCLRAAAAAGFCMPSALCERISDDDVASALSAVPTHTPQAIGFELELCLSRRNDHRFREMARLTLERLARGVKLREVDPAGGIAKFVGAIVTPKLARLFPESSVLWRHYAALAHGILVAEAFHGEERLLDIFETYWRDQFGFDDLICEAWNLRSTPRIQVLFELSMNPWIRAAAIAQSLLTAVEPDQRPNVPEFEEYMRSEYASLATKLAQDFPTAFGGISSVRELADVETIALPQIPLGGDENASAPAWNFEIALSMVALVDAASVKWLTERAQTITLENLFELRYMARMALSQGNLDLSSAVTERALSVLRDATELSHVGAIFEILTVAAAVRREDWQDYLAGVFLRAASAVRSGSCAQALANLISALDKFVPVERRRWWRASALARSAV